MNYRTPEELVEYFLKNEAGINPIERGGIFLRINEDFEWSWSKIGREIKKSPAYVINTVRLAKLPEAVKDGLISGSISEGHARALLGISDIRTVIEAYKNILKQKLSVRLTEQMVRSLKKDLKSEEASGGDLDRGREDEEEVEALVEEIKGLIKGKGKIDHSFWLAGARIEIVLDAARTEIKELLEKIKKGLAQD